MERDYWPESPLFSVGAQGCEHHPYRRQRGVLPAAPPYLQVSSRYESSVMRNGTGQKEPEVRPRKIRPYLDSPI